MDISQRQSDILRLIVDEYVRSAKPISSVFVSERCDLDICPATIRIEMSRLGDGGYIKQTHISSGRVPTTRGYRYLVDQIEEVEAAGIKARGSSMWEILSSLTRLMSQEASSLAIGGVPSRGFFAREGWSSLLSEPEFEDRDAGTEFTQMLDAFEKKAERLEKDLDIFIGSENPFGGSNDFSMVVGRFPIENEIGIVAIVGPKRMRYDKNIGIIKAAKRFLEDNL